MKDPAVIIRFDSNGHTCRPGDTLSGEYRIESIMPGEIKAVEVSVLWYSEGKGDEDLAVHEFWRLNAEDGDLIDSRRPERFITVLPKSPLSYDGVIIKLRWCVRVRVFLRDSKEVVGERTFRLGNVPAARATTP